MVAPDGSPLEDRQGVPVIKTHILRPSDSAEAIAKVLTRKVRRQMLGLTETEEAFGRPLIYSHNGVA
jgi:hypothetical protein